MDDERTQLNFSTSYPTPDLVDIIGFVLQHPLREQVFPGWDDASIANSLLHSNLDRNLLITVDNDSNLISGVAQYTPHDERRVIFVSTILTRSIGNGAFKAFVNVLHKRWPGWKVETFRRRDNRLVTYSFKTPPPPQNDAHGAQTITKESEEYANN